MKIVCTVYSDFTDRASGVRFTPELRDGLYVGVAEAKDAKVLKLFKDREGFEVLAAEKKTGEPDKGAGQDGGEGTGEGEEP